jgi:hypothetical protein
VRPGKAKAERRPATGRKSATVKDAARHRLERRLAEALGRQAATAEILRAISSSPTDSSAAASSAACSSSTGSGSTWWPSTV